jgi:predicted HicB family RNase H-like nuclease
MTKHKGFIPTFYIDLERNIIRGRVLNAKDTITFHGKTPAEAWDAFRDSVEDYLAFCAERGIEPEKPSDTRRALDELETGDLIPCADADDVFAKADIRRD